MSILELITNVNIFALAPSIFFVVDSCPVAAKMGYSIFHLIATPFFLFLRWTIVLLRTTWIPKKIFFFQILKNAQKFNSLLAILSYQLLGGE